MNAPNYLPQVREQYEALPYPPCNPQDEHTGLTLTALDRLDYLNHRFFDGRETFGSHFRVLSAGDGTGNASIFLAEQLAHTGGHVVALDLSTASQAIAIERARIRKLTNITYLNASLLDLPTLGLGEFDYVSCSGVLHHLDDPDIGLKALASVLKPHGVIGVFVYGAVGRTAIYHMQNLLKRVLKNVSDLDEKIALTRTIISQLPPTNWVSQDAKWPYRDWARQGDAGLVDLLLHPQDRAYTVEQIYDWAARCRLNVAEFCVPYSHQDILYNPRTHVSEAVVTSYFDALPQARQQKIAELLCGTMDKHQFYVTRENNTAELSVHDHSLIPSWSMLCALHNAEREDMMSAINAAAGKKSVTIPLTSMGKIKLSPLSATADLIAAIDNTRSVGDIIGQVATRHPTLSHEAIAAQFHTLFEECRLYGMIVLRRAEGAAFESVAALHARYQTR